jgi:hypothetical protein
MVMRGVLARATGLLASRRQPALTMYMHGSPRT